RDRRDPAKGRSRRPRGASPAGGTPTRRPPARAGHVSPGRERRRWRRGLGGHEARRRGSRDGAGERDRGLRHRLMSRLALLHPAVIGMGLRVAGERARRTVRGVPRSAGSAEQILRAGLEGCWNGEVLTASPRTYRHFWTRDLGFAAPALMRLGGPWPDRLQSSLGWALGAWRRRRSHVTTTIDPVFRHPVDVFDEGVDSLP